MFLSFNPEDLFIFSSNFPEPLNRSILKHYLKKEIFTYEFFINKFLDNENIEYYKSRVKNINDIIDNLEGFWNDINVKEEVFDDNQLNITKYFDNDNIYYFTIDDIIFIEKVIEDDGHNEGEEYQSGDKPYISLRHSHKLLGHLVSVHPGSPGDGEDQPTVDA